MRRAGSSLQRGHIIGDERRQDHPSHEHTTFSVEMRQCHEAIVDVALNVVERAVAVDQLSGLLLELGGTHGLGLALRRQVSLRKKEKN